MLASERVPHAMLFSGPRGVGKFTLARMFAQAANCERLRDDFCGECDTCRDRAACRPAPLIEQGLAERGESADAATVERVPLILETHPDVWADRARPSAAEDSCGAARISHGTVARGSTRRLFQAAWRGGAYLFWMARRPCAGIIANIFLKILEEPPDRATLILLAPNPYRLLPTIRSRCLQFFLLRSQTTGRADSAATDARSPPRIANWPRNSPRAAPESRCPWIWRKPRNCGARR